LAALSSSVLWIVATEGVAAQAVAASLSPRDAARDLVLNEAVADAAKPGAEASSDVEKAMVEKIPGLVRASQATPRQRAERGVGEATSRALRPWQRSGRMRDARYWYIGHSIDAMIYADGKVELRKKDGIALSLLTVMAPEVKAGGAGGLPNARADSTDDGASRSLGNPKFGLREKGSEGASGGVGISIPQTGRAFERLVTGKEPLNAEARVFLEQTRPLREFLLAEAAAQEATRALARLEADLRRSWAKPGPLGRKQAELLSRWEECADDALGSQARARIVAFVQELERDHGACPFSAEELAKLNAGRESERAFTPCATKPEGAQHARGGSRGP
jgi:hypothetical protein